jgi:hypothetical protein
MNHEINVVYRITKIICIIPAHNLTSHELPSLPAKSFKYSAIERRV